MKSKAARESALVTLDPAKRETRLLGGGWEMNNVDPPGGEVSSPKEASFTERLNERATKRTQLLEGILNIHTPPSHWGINE